ncbi:hypothetical protein VTN00DRAFT_10146 [Thermoascus crustaceus]|uniref:uncharacterized protein n=1 Tax=Thermoascus crustaceus TaxID=5088 RepID=UPI0037444D6C
MPDISDHSSRSSLEEASRKWMALIARGNGFIDIHDPDSYNLPPRISVNGQKLYAIAIFHQLHCLHMIMRNYDMLLTGDLHREDMDDNDFWHVDYCFDYLRQSLLCCGDTALEGQNNFTDLPGTDGTGGTHVCKRYGDIWEWAEERRISNRTRI